MYDVRLQTMVSFIKLKIHFLSRFALLIYLTSNIYGYFAQINLTDCIIYYLQDISVYLPGYLQELGFFQKSGLTNAQLVILFLLKVMAVFFMDGSVSIMGSIAYMSDTWGYHYLSVDEYKLLFQ
jgi:hypothetical protein